MSLPSTHSHTLLHINKSSDVQNVLHTECVTVVAIAPVKGKRQQVINDLFKSHVKHYKCPFFPRFTFSFSFSCILCHFYYYCTMSVPFHRCWHRRISFTSLQAATTIHSFFILNFSQHFSSALLCCWVALKWRILFSLPLSLDYPLLLWWHNMCTCRHCNAIVFSHGVDGMNVVKWCGTHEKMCFRNIFVVTPIPSHTLATCRAIFNITKGFGGRTICHKIKSV